MWRWSCFPICNSTLGKFIQSFFHLASVLRKFNVSKLWHEHRTLVFSFPLLVVRECLFFISFGNQAPSEIHHVFFVLKFYFPTWHVTIVTRVGLRFAIFKHKLSGFPWSIKCRSAKIFWHFTSSVWFRVLSRADLAGCSETGRAD